MPPSPTSTSLKVGISSPVAIILSDKSQNFIELIGFLHCTCMYDVLNDILILSVTETVLLDLVDLPWWSPLNEVGVHQQSWFFVLCTLQMLLNQLGSDADNMLT